MRVADGEAEIKLGVTLGVFVQGSAGIRGRPISEAPALALACTSKPCDSWAAQAVKLPSSMPASKKAAVEQRSWLRVTMIEITRSAARKFHT